MNANMFLIFPDISGHGDTYLVSTVAIASANDADQLSKKIAREKPILSFSAILAKRGNLNLTLHFAVFQAVLMFGYCGRASYMNPYTRTTANTIPTLIPSNLYPKCGVILLLKMWVDGTGDGTLAS